MGATHHFEWVVSGDRVAEMGRSGPPIRGRADPARRLLGGGILARSGGPFGTAQRHRRAADVRSWRQPRGAPRGRGVLRPPPAGACRRCRLRSSLTHLQVCSLRSSAPPRPASGGRRAGVEWRFGRGAGESCSWPNLPQLKVGRSSGVIWRQFGRPDANFTLRQGGGGRFRSSSRSPIGPDFRVRQVSLDRATDSAAGRGPPCSST
jgi:hypothetical protein